MQGRSNIKDIILYCLANVLSLYKWKECMMLPLWFDTDVSHHLFVSVNQWVYKVQSSEELGPWTWDYTAKFGQHKSSSVSKTPSPWRSKAPPHEQNAPVSWLHHTNPTKCSKAAATMWQAVKSTCRHSYTFCQLLCWCLPWCSSHPGITASD